MCLMCDGWTYEEVLQDLDETIQRSLWAVQGVDAPRPWTYTIGLTERYGHPELVLAGVDPGLAGPVLNALGQQVACGVVFEAGGAPAAVGEVIVDFVRVHPVHLAAGLMGMWEGRYERWECPPPLEALQVLPRGGRAPRLDAPHTTLQI